MGDRLGICGAVFTFILQETFATKIEQYGTCSLVFWMILMIFAYALSFALKKCFAPPPSTLKNASPPSPPSLKNVLPYPLGALDNFVNEIRAQNVLIHELWEDRANIVLPNRFGSDNCFAIVRALAIGEDNAYAPLHQAEKIIPCLSSSTEKNNPLPPMITLAKKFQPYIKEKNNYFLPLCNNFEIIVGHPNSNCPNFEKTIIGLYNRLKSLSYFVTSAITRAFV